MSHTLFDSTKPLLLFDGDCTFCRVWVNRWKHITHDRVVYLPYQDAASAFPNIPRSEFEKAVQLIEPDGKRTSAALAVFRALRYGGLPLMEWAYEKVPGFGGISEFIYGIVAGNRPAFSALTRWVWGFEPVPESYGLVRWVFLRAFGIIYGIAFWSFGAQIKGLVGSSGMMPAHDFLQQLSGYGTVRFWYVPTLAWFNSSDAFLVGLCITGVVASIVLFLNIIPRASLVALWVLYLSLCSIGSDFMNFQWDALLLETGFLAIFLAPSGIFPQRRGASSPSRISLFLLRWLLFRLMIQSAIVKWASGDSLWHQFNALSVHYQTQPLPNLLSWYAHHLPLWFHKISCGVMFGIEGFAPFLIFAPRRVRMVGFYAMVFLQLLIHLTGNYTYFNLLALALCLLLLDDATLRSWLPFLRCEPLADRHSRESGNPVALTSLDPRLRGGDVKKTVSLSAGLCVFFLTCIPFSRVLRIPLPPWAVAPAIWVSPLRSFNSYGLFAVMTPSRPEIILEGSMDGNEWKAYEFKYKPGDLSRPPMQVAPFQPRLDWQMWFAALGDYRQNPWFINLCFRLLQGSSPVLSLLENNPFPSAPPVYLRSTVYDYRFTTPAERKETGAWWARERKGPYCPVISFRKS